MSSWTDDLNTKEARALGRLESPALIQAFLDAIPYSTDPIYRCPRRVLRDRKAHCFDGAVFAAAALRRLGHPPLILDMLPENDDDHVLALYRQRGRWGAVAKSNFTGLRLREPVYRDLRELVMSYFEDFYNSAYERTLRGYTLPVNLEVLDLLNWMARDEAMDVIAGRLDRARKFALITPEMAAALTRMDKRSYDAGMMGTNPAGLYKPPRKK